MELPFMLLILVVVFAICMFLMKKDNYSGGYDHILNSLISGAKNLKLSISVDNLTKLKNEVKKVLPSNYEDGDNIDWKKINDTDYYIIHDNIFNSTKTILLYLVYNVKNNIMPLSIYTIEQWKKKK